MTHIHGTSTNQNVSAAQRMPFALQEGKVLNVRVHKHLGDAQAEVSVNGQRFIAKLETPVEAGGRYWVEVKQSEKGISLAVISDPRTGEMTAKGMIADLLRHMAVKNQGEGMTSLLNELVKNRLPFDKDMLLFAEKHVTGKGDAENIKILVDIAKRNLPFTEKVFQSMKAGLSKEGFVSMLNTLSGKLSETGTDKSTLQLIKNIQNPVNGMLMERMVGKSLSMLSSPSQSFSARLGHFDLLKSLGFLPEGATMNQWKDGVASAIVKGASAKGYVEKNIERAFPLLNGNDAGGRVGKELNRLQAAAGGEPAGLEKAGRSLVNTLLSNMGEGKGNLETKLLMGLISEEQKQSMEINFGNLERSLAKGVPLSNQGRVFHQLYQQLEQEFTQEMQGDELTKVLKRVIGSLGINYEAQLQKKGYELQPLNLKESLVSLSLTHPLPEVRQLADDIVMKLNHQVLVSQENAPLLTIIQQFPLFLFGRNTDITLQWTGKEKEKGIIDEDFCRVLFYLELDSLKETLIDMQVQNRVITLTVWNDDPAVEKASLALLPKLKAGLMELDYRLTSVKVKTPDRDKDLSKDSLVDLDNTTFTGVDILV
ncbi:hypothetical protein [Bacillus sp. KH172YL63]|uniref:hypothetical protein n=1 Tax=Bacillus sp. KH172YL63 TaxID=2709784 RepID=UPI0013E429E6|nr:hypothetical protein [Bacillus sp. KH172YL63]BCB03337.1 hypothetical protein KH172YL63_14700 [Bacillus sp. KH172YL63]